jgi:hypothetical protein
VLACKGVERGGLHLLLLELHLLHLWLLHLLLLHLLHEGWGRGCVLACEGVEGGGLHLLLLGEVPKGRSQRYLWL